LRKVVIVVVVCGVGRIISQVRNKSPGGDSVNTLFFGLITLAIVALVVFLVWLIINVVDAIRSVKKFLVTTEEAMGVTLGEVNQSLKSLRNVTDNITVVTDDVKGLSGSLRDAGRSVRQVGESIRRVGEIVQSIGSETTGTVSGLKAGIKTGFDTLLRNLFSGGPCR